MYMDLIRCNYYPATRVFLINGVPEFVRRYNAYDAYIKKTSTLSNDSKPEVLKEKKLKMN